MPTLLERVITTYETAYGKPAEPQPTPGPTPASILGGVMPPLTQTEKFAATYRQASIPAERSESKPANVSAVSAAQQRAMRDATWPLLTQIQKMARTYGPETSDTLPQANLVLVEYRRKTAEAGVDRVTSGKVLDGLLAAADDPSSIPVGAGLAEYHQRTRAIGIADDAARKCLDVYLALGKEP